MTPAQHALLTSIQALTLAGARQTALRFNHDVRGATDDLGTYVCSDVRVYDGNLELLHKTKVMVGHDGDDDPDIYTSATERTLRQQRDELVEFIATHRKQEAAA